MAFPQNIHEPNVREEKLALEEKYVINPRWVMANDKDRVLLYKLDLIDYRLTILSPRTAMALCFLDGHRTLAEVAVLYQLVFASTDMAAALFECTQLYAAVNRLGDIIVPIGSVVGTVVTYKPQEFIVTNAAPPRARLTRPIRCTLFFTNKCQTDCVYCYAERTAVTELPFTKWVAIFEEMHSIGIRMVEPTGGDPLARSDSFDLCCELIRLNMLFLISTKCLVTEMNAHRLTEAGFNFHPSGARRPFQLSVDAATPDVADQMVRTPGFLKMALTSVQNLVKAGIRVRIKSVLTPINFNEVESIVDLFSDLGVTEFYFSFYGRSAFRHNDGLFLSPDEKQWAADKCASIKTKRADLILDGDPLHYVPEPLTDEARLARWNARGAGACTGGLHSLAIAADGRVVLCEQVPLREPFVVGDLRHQDIMEVWNSPQLHAFLTPNRELFEGTICHECDEFSMCHHEGRGCFREAYKAYKTRYAPTPDCVRVKECFRRD